MVPIQVHVHGKTSVLILLAQVFLHISHIILYYVQIQYSVVLKLLPKFWLLYTKKSMRKSFGLQFASVSHLLSLETIFLLGTIISTYQPYSYETSILLPKVIIGTLFLSHSLREMDVSGVKLKHVNMFRQVPQTLLEFLDHCFRQHTASYCELKLIIRKTQVDVNP